MVIRVRMSALLCCISICLIMIIVHTINLLIRGSKENTSLTLKRTSTMIRDQYIKELHLIKARSLYDC